MDIVTTIISTVISTGVISAIFHHYYDKKIRTHELKLQKYFDLIEELSKLVEGTAEEDKMRRILNDALFFSSDKVVREILIFNKLFTKHRNESIADKNTTVRIDAEDITPLVKAIRTELYLKSESIDEEGLRFFQKVK